MTEPDFWDDNIAAQKTSQELNELKQTYENFHQMVDLFDESEILLDFLAEDDSVKEELIEKLEELDKRMTSYEMTLLLSEPYDNNNAILEIHQVQEEQKLRTGATCSFGCILVLEMPMASKLKSWTYQAGDEAGIKSVTLSFEGLMHTAF